MGFFNRPLFCLLLIVSNAHAFQELSLTKDQWMTDIERLDNIINTVHPNPFIQVTSSEWKTKILTLKKLAGTISNQEMSVCIAKVVSTIKDGHTTIDFNDDLGFGRWYPIRFYSFEEGLYVTVTLHEYKDLIGSKIISFNGVEPNEALDSISTIISPENEFHAKNLAASFLSNQTLLETLELVQKNTELLLKVQLPNGKLVERRIKPTKSWYSSNYRFWGELFGPPIENFESYVTPFENGKNPLKYRIESKKAPPYYANRSPYWFRYDEKNRTLLFQFNFAAELGEESFDQFLERLLSFANKVEIEKFVVDSRFNFGGDGSMMRPLVHTLIEIKASQNEMRFFTLVGRQTFSAGVMLVSEMAKHFNSVLVGEPAGAGFSHFGDPRSYTLPNSGLKLNVSTLLWQLGHPTNHENHIKINYPVIPKASDYFSSIDRAYDLVVKEDVSLLSDMMVNNKVETDLIHQMNILKNKYASYYWWSSLDKDWDLLLDKINYLAKTRLANTINFVKTWIEFEPNNIIAWETLGQLYEKSNELTKLESCYENILKLDKYRTDIEKKLLILKSKN